MYQKLSPKIKTNETATVATTNCEALFNSNDMSTGVQRRLEYIKNQKQKLNKTLENTTEKRACAL